MKVVTISALFPELKGGRCNQQGRGRGSTLQSAMGAATRDLLKQKGLRKQRFTEFSATFTVGTVREIVETPDLTERNAETEQENAEMSQ